MKQQDRYQDQHGWDKIISPITLKMKKGTWEVFKSLTSRNTKLNEAVLQLIHKFINENTEKSIDKEVKKWCEDQEYWAKKRKNRLIINKK